MMKSATTRRAFVGAASSAAVFHGLGLSLLAGNASAADKGAALNAEQLATGLVWIRGAGANLLALRDPDGLVFIDGGLAAHADAVLKLAARQLGSGRAHTLINTHWHHDHTGLNDKLGKAGATIISHEQTRLWLSTTVRYDLDALPIRPLPKHAQPNKTTWSDGELAAGGEILRYGLMSQAHTDGDIYVKLEKANVLVTGGVVAGHAWPIPDWVTGGAITGLVGGYRTLIAQCDDATRIVTAGGDKLYTKAELSAEADIMNRLSGELSRMMRSGYGPEDVLTAAPAKDYASRLGDPDEFLVESFKSLWPRMAPDA